MTSATVHEDHSAPAAGDAAGLFGPGTVSWQVHRESTVLLGGARALLMQAAHPLVVAGARQTAMYERDPWKRLLRTVVQTYTVVFGTREEALAASKRIDDIHGVIKGVDPVTGLPYDARDPELLLWVHACLIDSFLTFERLTVGKLDAAGRQRFHEESMLSAGLLRLPRSRIPPTVEALDAYLREMFRSDMLRLTEGAESVANLVREPPPTVPRRPLWHPVSFLAQHTLPAELRALYGVRHGRRERAGLRLLASALRYGRPIAPPAIRYIGPARLADERLRKLGGRAHPSDRAGSPPAES